MMHAIDRTFLDAFRRAVVGDTKPLDCILRSGAALGPGERELVALLDGQPERAVKGGSLKPEQERHYAARYIAGGSNEAAMSEIVKWTGMDRATVYGWVRTLRGVLARVPDPEALLRSLVECEAEFERIMRGVTAANRVVLHEQKAKS
jgi:hypothetical protein